MKVNMNEEQETRSIVARTAMSLGLEKSQPQNFEEIAAAIDWWINEEGADRSVRLTAVRITVERARRYVDVDRYLVYAEQVADFIEGEKKTNGRPLDAAA